MVKTMLLTEYCDMIQLCWLVMTSTASHGLCAHDQNLTIIIMVHSEWEIPHIRSFHVQLIWIAQDGRIPYA